MDCEGLILEKREYVFLKRVLNISGYVDDFETQKSLQRLSNELKSAHIVDDCDMPLNVILFNSKVTVSSDRGWEKTLQVVVPADKDVALSKVTVLTPMGSAIFGNKEGAIISWMFPTGMQELTITKVIQDALEHTMEVVL
jgi:regulator of nucleoside diphosphate kinase